MYIDEYRAIFCECGLPYGQCVCGTFMDSKLTDKMIAERKDKSIVEVINELQTLFVVASTLTKGKLDKHLKIDFIGELNSFCNKIIEKEEY